MVKTSNGEINAIIINNNFVSQIMSLNNNPIYLDLDNLSIGFLDDFSFSNFQNVRI